jgi:hypothetical protein
MVENADFSNVVKPTPQEEGRVPVERLDALDALELFRDFVEKGEVWLRAYYADFGNNKLPGEANVEVDYTKLESEFAVFTKGLNAIDNFLMNVEMQGETIDGVIKKMNALGIDYSAHSLPTQVNLFSLGKETWDKFIHFFHDLRRPITVITSYFQFLTLFNPDAKKAAEYLVNINRSIPILLSQIDELNPLVEHSTDRDFPLRSCALDLKSYVEGAVSLYLDVKLEIVEFDVAPLPLNARSRFSLNNLVNILENYIQNTIRYGSIDKNVAPTMRISCRFDEEKDMFWLVTEDSGPGFPVGEDMLVESQFDGSAAVRYIPELGRTQIAKVDAKEDVKHHGYGLNRAKKSVLEKGAYFECLTLVDVENANALGARTEVGIPVSFSEETSE